MKEARFRAKKRLECGGKAASITHCDAGWDRARPVVEEGKAATAYVQGWGEKDDSQKCHKTRAVVALLLTLP
jgi:hypothetical protein